MSLLAKCFVNMDVLHLVHDPYISENSTTHSPNPLRASIKEKEQKKIKIVKLIFDPYVSPFRSRRGKQLAVRVDGGGTV
jgi:hypothetical protein